MAMGSDTAKQRRYGGLVFVIAVVQFIAVMLIVEAAYPCLTIPQSSVASGVVPVCYNPLTNPISDLGNTVTSPLWPLFDYSIVLFGALIVLGIFLVRGAFKRGIASLSGLVILGVSAMGSAGVGVVPENTILAIHSIFALTTFFLGGLSALLLGMSMVKDRTWKNFWVYSIVSGVFSIAVLIFFVAHGNWMTSGNGLVIGFGAVERLVAFSVLIWALVIGVKLLRK